MTMTARIVRAWPRLLATVISMAVLAVGISGLANVSQAVADTVHSPIVGSGSTWSANALQTWIRNVWANYQWKITYSESGSTIGRTDFANGTADFGVSEIPYAIANSNEQDSRPNRKYAYMPIVAGGTAFMYNLVIGGKKVSNLRLSGETVAKIFTGVISRWDDPAIKADNPSLALPSIPIVPVVRSDGSGATAQVSIWLRQMYPKYWDAYCGKVGRAPVNGHCGVTSNYPTVAGSGFVSRSGSNGVAGYVAQSHSVGAITFVEYSYALNAGFPVAKLLNAAGYYTEPTAQNVAVALLKAKINENENSADYLTQNLASVYTDSDKRSYPLSSYSYIILPTALEDGFTNDKGVTLADFGAYFLCEGQQSAEVLGYSPLPINLVKAGQKQIQKIPGGNPAIKGIAGCNNPTFSSDGSNKLAKTAPYPPECDKQGATQCATGTGGAKESTAQSGSGTDAASQSGTAVGADGTAGAATGAGVGGITSGQQVSGTPQSIPQARLTTTAYASMAAAGALLLGFSVAPPLLRTRGRHTWFRRDGWRKRR
jgi:phosphate ABC transporter phosphate-binding protein